MAFNGGYPYQQYYPQYQQSSYQQNNGIIWVQGEAGAKSYLVAPNTTVQLWDSESQCIYLKSADASGMPSMRVLEYTIRENSSDSSLNGFQKKSANAQAYATKDEIGRIEAELRSLRDELDNLSSSKRTRKEVMNDE